jgi:diguanylate cyclase (GGDEF)-like protein
MNASNDRVLYMEDDRGQAYLVRKALEREGFRVDLARDGSEGLTRHAVEPYDVLIVDQNMPELSGLEVIRRLAAEAGQPPIIMLTGAGNEGVAVEAMKLGASDYLTKDAAGVYLELLPTILRRTLGQRRGQVEQKEAVAALEQERSQILSIFEGLEEAIYVSDPNSYELLFVNRALQKLYGDRPMVGEHCYSALQDRDSPCKFCTNPILLAHPERIHRWENRNPATGRDCAVTNRLMRWPDGRVVRFDYALDITDRKRTQERLEHLAYHDLLTGLPNRRLFRDRLDTALALAERHGHHLGLLFLDIDEFKSVNDMLGHHAGDILLSAVARRLQSAVRRTDSVARFGGDEFVVLLPEIAHPDDAVLIGEKIVALMKRPFKVDDTEVSGVCSVGTVVFPSDGTTSEELLRNADEALYRAKLLGKGTHHVFEGGKVNGASPGRWLKESLATALQSDQFVLHYQPLISLRSREVLGVEALVRWAHPTRGLLPPSEFLPFVESAGLGAPLDGWVLRQACRQVRAWEEMGLPPVRVAVNLSRPQLQSPDLGTQVREILDSAGLESRRIDLEVTETIAVEEIETCLDRLELLRDLGFGLSLDDFGTGGTSVSHLQRLPINCVKLDQTLVWGIGRGAKQSAMVSAIIAFAHGLNLAVVAEGTETREQAEFLLQAGCDAGQGFFFAPARPPEELDLKAGFRSFAGPESTFANGG